MATLAHPYEAKTFPALAQKILHDPPPLIATKYAPQPWWVWARSEPDACGLIARAPKRQRAPDGKWGYGPRCGGWAATQPRGALAAPAPR